MCRVNGSTLRPSAHTMNGTRAPSVRDEATSRRQPIELGTHTEASLALRCLECCRELRPAIERISALPGLDLGVLGGDLQALGLGEARRRRAAPRGRGRTALLGGGDAVVGDDRGTAGSLGANIPAYICPKKTGPKANLLRCSLDHDFKMIRLYHIEHVARTVRHDVHAARMPHAVVDKPGALRRFGLPHPAPEKRHSSRGRRPRRGAPAGP